jgi:putative membrane protein
VEAWATGFPIALLHLAVALAIFVVAAALYALLSPNREIGLIREGNSAAALSFGGVLVGLGLPLAVALAASRSVLDVALWGVSVAAVALALFWVTDLALQGLPQRVREGDVPAAALLAAAKLAVAAILAAAVTG